MIKQIPFALVLGCFAILLASYAARDEPKDDAPPGKGLAQEAPVKTETPPAKPDPREVTLHVDGMSDRLKLI